MVTAAAMVCIPLQRIVQPSNLSLVFLTAVLFSALRYGLWPAIFASALSELVWNFFFVPPRFSLRIDDPQDLLALILFVIVSLVVGNLAAAEKRQAAEVRARAEATARLYDFSQQIATMTTPEALVEAVDRTVGAILDCRVSVRLGKGETSLASAAPPYTVGLEGPSRSFGTISITRDPATLTADQRVLLTLLLEQAAVAVERLQLAKSIEQANLRAEMEHLRSAMLTSLSHDLRTPLTVIVATHSTLRTLDAPADAPLRAELLDRAQAEAERLNRFIGNLLDMTKLESGKLNLKLSPIDVIDAVQSAVDRASPLLGGHRLHFDMPPSLPMATADFMLLEQVIFNLLDNAAKYAPSPSSIMVSGKTDAGLVRIEISDEGPGIPAGSCAAIFDKFTRLRHEDQRSPGTGLGLAICRGFLAAMGGAITASNRTDRSGAIFTVDLVRAELPAGMG